MMTITTMSRMMTMACDSANMASKSRQCNPRKVMPVRKLQETVKMAMQASHHRKSRLALVWEGLPPKIDKLTTRIGRTVASSGQTSRAMDAASESNTKASMVKIDVNKAVVAAGTTTMTGEATTIMARAALAAVTHLTKIVAMAVTEMEVMAAATITEATIIEETISASKVAHMKSLTKSKLTLIRTTVCTTRTIQVSSANALSGKKRPHTSSRSTCSNQKISAVKKGSLPSS